MRETRWGGWARYGLPGAVLGATLAIWGAGGHTPEARAQVAAGQRGQAGGGDSAGTFAFTAALGAPSQGQMLYLIDTKAQAFAVYRVDPGNQRGAVKLEAARRYGQDLKLSEYNNAPPEVSAIESMVRTVPPR